MSQREGEGRPPAGRVERPGTAASPGFGMGPAYVLERRDVQVPYIHIDADTVKDEQKRFRSALSNTHEQLESIKTRLPHGEHRQLLKAQQMMLRDPDMIAQTEGLIREEIINAEWAVVKSMDQIRDMLGRAADEYLRERRFDVAFLSERLLRNLLGEQAEGVRPPEGAVVVAHDLSPADTAQLHRCKVAGIVTGVGGPTTHAAIMARALGIPAVVGVERKTSISELVDARDMVVVDAVRGRVVFRPEDAELDQFRNEAQRYAEFEARFAPENPLPAVTLDGVHVELRANLALDEELASVAVHGARGVGLYRTEYLFLGRDQPPTEEEHYRVAKRVLQSCAPHSVVFRTFDLGSDKKCKYFESDEPEANPAMGLRSLRLAFNHPDLFKAQLRGLLRAGLHGPMKIMFPLVSGLAELRRALDALEVAAAELEDEGLPYARDIPVGIMIEVPSAAVMSDILARHVDFMSIGTNDLIQYSIAIDRENDAVNYLYEPLHPAIMRLIRQVCAAGKSADIPVSICGEMASDPRYAWALIGLGVRELSVHPGAVPVLKNVIRSSREVEMVALAESLLAVDTAEEAAELIAETMGMRFPEHLLHGSAS